MIRHKRVVVDTNILVSALLFEHSKPAQIVFAVIADGTLLFSLETIQEISDVLHRKKFAKYVTGEEREIFLNLLILHSEMVEIVEYSDICRDPKDNKILDVAINGQADFIVSGDQDLLILQTVKTTKIVNADEFVHIISTIS